MSNYGYFKMFFHLYNFLIHLRKYSVFSEILLMLATVRFILRKGFLPQRLII